MATTVNDVSAITADSQRELTGVEVHGFLRPLHGEILRARVFLDSSSDLIIDSPLVANALSNGTQRIFLVGIEYALDVAHTLAFYSKVGSGADKLIAGKFKVSAFNGMLEKINQDIIGTTDPGGVLVLNVSTASGANPFEGVIFYQIADKFNIPTVRN